MNHPWSAARRGQLMLAPLVAVLGSVVIASPAAAVIRPAVTLDGPSSDIIGVDDAALAGDGSGGIVFRKREDGEIRVFVSRFGDGVWTAPRRVVSGVLGDASSARIAAGTGGRLLVTWVQALGSVGGARMYSSALDPGTTTFQRPLPVDLNIVGDTAAIDPTLVMNDGGSALIAYRVVTQTNLSDAPAGWVKAEFRLARWRGGTWARRGAINRAVNTPVPPADAGNGPKLAIDRTGNGVVAWQEPDDGLIPRVWARRIFSGTTVGIPLPASPQQVDGRQLAAGADRVSVSTAGLGVAVVGFRQLPDPRTSITTPALMVNTLPDATSTKAAAFEGARSVVPNLANIGPQTSVSIDPDGQYRLAAGSGAAIIGVTGDQQRGRARFATMDPGSEIAADPRVEVGSEHQAAWAWPLQRGSESGIGVLEQPTSGDEADGVVAAQFGGPVSDLRMAGSGLGDALIAFRQGPSRANQVAAAYVDAAPSEFGVTTPVDWVRPAKAKLTWDPAPDAIGGVTYGVALDGQVITRNLKTGILRPPVSRLDDGRYRVQVIARDAQGQETAGSTATLKIDSSAPQATIEPRSGLKVDVRLTDKQPEGSSGISSSTIRFGDGTSSKGKRAVHRYKRSGRYAVTVTARDRAGNKMRIRTRVAVG